MFLWTFDNNMDTLPEISDIEIGDEEETVHRYDPVVSDVSEDEIPEIVKDTVEREHEEIDVKSKENREEIDENSESVKSDEENDKDKKGRYCV